MHSRTFSKLPGFKNIFVFYDNAYHQFCHAKLFSQTRNTRNTHTRFIFHYQFYYFPLFTLSCFTSFTCFLWRNDLLRLITYSKYTSHFHKYSENKKNTCLIIINLFNILINTLQKRTKFSRAKQTCTRR